VKLAVLGAGAIGGLVAAHLAHAGADVVVIARGAALATLRDTGLRVIGPDGDIVASPPATDDLSVIGGCDAVLLTLKATAIAAVAPALAAALGPRTAIVTMQNGIPWWYFDRHGGPLDGTRLRTVDPGGAIAASLDAGRVIGCVVYPAAEALRPGVIRHVEGTRLALGELDGARTDRVRAIAETLGGAGFKAPIRSTIRDEIWLKLLGNATLNPLSALTRARLDVMLADPALAALAADLMEEVASVARALGVRLELSVAQRLAGAKRVGEHKVSTLQDLEAGRPLELEALTGAVLEIAERLAVDTPRLGAVYACAMLLDRTARSAAAAVVDGTDRPG
jgi:2-dehydropantoate 2-reductase